MGAVAKKGKRILYVVLILLSAVLLTVTAYLLYVVFSYYRVEDNQVLNIHKNAVQSTVPAGSELSMVTYNIGFGAYSPDYSFFMDGGKYSRAFSEEAVEKNTNGAIGIVKTENADFVLLQEVDTDGTRSFHVNQARLISEGLEGYDSVFAQNYDSPYFFYPLGRPIGANKSGIMTFSAFSLTESLRRSLPVENSLYKFLDLDRAYTVSRAQTENGKHLVIYNVHLSAYTSDGTISDRQLEMLCGDMKSEYEKGNYVVAAGDFNKDMLGDSSEYFQRSQGDFNWAAPFEESLLPQEIKSYTGSNVPTCRNADSHYRGDGTDFVLSVDGFLVSDNIVVSSCQTLDTGFSYSDHNPVVLRFILN